MILDRTPIVFEFPAMMNLERAKLKVIHAPLFSGFGRQDHFAGCRFTGQKAHAHGAFTKPANSTEAFNSLHYIAAATVHDGDYWFDQLEKDKYENPEILDFAEHNVAMVGDAELEILTAHSWPGAAEITGKDGRTFYKRFEAHKGEISNPLTKAELQAKFRRMTPMLDSESVEQVIGAVDRLEELDDLGELTALL